MTGHFVLPRENRKVVTVPVFPGHRLSSSKNKSNLAITASSKTINLTTGLLFLWRQVFRIPRIIYVVTTDAEFEYIILMIRTSVLLDGVRNLRIDCKTAQKMFAQKVPSIWAETPEFRTSGVNELRDTSPECTQVYRAVVNRKNHGKFQNFA